MHITMQNQNDPHYNALFNDLMTEVFGFSFAPWHALDVWDDRYESYSLIDNHTMIANICLFKTDLLIEGKSLRAHQFGAVATRKQHEGKGYASKLLNHALSLYSDTPVFLFGNETVIDFYPKFGFQRVHQQTAVLDYTVENTREAQEGGTRLSLDSPLLLNLLQNRTMFSNILDCTNTQSIQRFHLLMEYEDSVYYLPRSKTVVIAQQNAKTLTIADIFTSEPVSFEQIAQELPFSDVHQIAFGFCPDRLSITPTWVDARDDTESPLFIKGNIHFPDQFRFPFLSMT